MSTVNLSLCATTAYREFSNIHRYNKTGIETKYHENGALGTAISPDFSTLWSVIPTFLQYLFCASAAYHSFTLGEFSENHELILNHVCVYTPTPHPLCISGGLLSNCIQEGIMTFRVNQINIILQHFIKAFFEHPPIFQNTMVFFCALDIWNCSYNL